MRNVYLVQVNWSNTAGNTAGHWIPYSVGSIWAYCSTIPELRSNYRLAELIFRRERLQAVLDRMEEPHVVGFSTYIWTEQYNLALARAIRARWPDAVLVFGGPQVPNDCQSYFERFPMIDVAVHAEGEHAFAQILSECLAEHPDFRNVAGCSVNVEGVAVRSEPPIRIRDLEPLPSPYLAGVFDGIMSNHLGADWNAVIETNRGCPYKCTFCDWGSLTYNKVARFPIERVFDEIRWIASHRISYICPADSNFGLFADRDRQIAEYFVECKDEFGFPNSVGMAFAKNSNTRVVEIAELLHSAKLLKAMTLSAQSMSPVVLANIERQNMALSDFSSILAECNRRGVPTYTEMILGLPGETYSSWKDGLCQILECGQHNQLESWLLELLPNSRMAQADSVAEHGLRSVRLKNYCFVFDHQVADEIPEEVDIVFETRTMPYEDLQKSLGFSMLIFNLHAYGWTQAIARLLRAGAGVPFADFYGSLEVWVVQNKDTLISQEYRATIDAIRTMVDSGDYVVERFLRDINIGSVPIGLRSQGFFHLDPSRTHREVEDFVSSVFSAELAQLPDDALEFQRHFVTWPTRSYPYSTEFSTDFVAMMFGEGRGAQPVRYSFNVTYNFESIDDYLGKVYSRKKQGFGKAVISLAE